MAKIRAKGSQKGKASLARPCVEPGWKQGVSGCSLGRTEAVA